MFEEVHRKQSDFGLVPVENSTDGRVADTLEMFTRMRVRICGDIELRIHHILLGKCSRTEVREVYSKPQALSQCRNWLAKHLPAARTIEVTSTSTAAQLAAEKPARPPSPACRLASITGWTCWPRTSKTIPRNTTRFAVIGDQVSPRTGKDRTAMLFQTEHRPGALADAMMIFKRNRVELDLDRVVPRFPARTACTCFSWKWKGTRPMAPLRRAVAALGKKALRLEILGSFPASPPVE